MPSPFLVTTLRQTIFLFHGDGPELRDTSAVTKAGIENRYSPETNFGSNRMVR